MEKEETIWYPNQNYHVTKIFLKNLTAIENVKKKQKHIHTNKYYVYL